MAKGKNEETPWKQESSAEKKPGANSGSGLDCSARASDNGGGRGTAVPLDCLAASDRTGLQSSSLLRGNSVQGIVALEDVARSEVPSRAR